MLSCASEADTDITIAATAHAERRTTLDLCDAIPQLQIEMQHECLGQDTPVTTFRLGRNSRHCRKQATTLIENVNGRFYKIAVEESCRLKLVCTNFESNFTQLHAQRPTNLTSIFTFYTHVYSSVTGRDLRVTFPPPHHRLTLFFLRL